MSDEIFNALLSNLNEMESIWKGKTMKKIEIKKLSDKTEVVMLCNDYDGPVYKLHNRELTLSEANIAEELVRRWGLVAGIPDGEDSAGRQQLRLLRPDELVSRACETAALFMAEVRKRGWTLEIPSLIQEE